MKTVRTFKQGNRHLHLSLLIGLYFLLFLVTSCKKDHHEAAYPMDEIIAPATGTRKELTLDSIFLYARQLYLWEETLPHYTTFAPRQIYGQITPEQTAYEHELYAISQYAIRGGGQPYEWTSTAYKAKYSYLKPANGQYGNIAGTANTGSYATDLRYWTTGDRIVAYFYISSFPSLSQVQQELDTLFAELATRQVTHLIIDLRHNGGGYVQTAEYLANLIAPSSLAGKMMFTEEFNSRMQEGRATILQYQPYFDADGNTVPYKGRIATLADADYSAAANTRYFEKKGNFQSVQQLSFLVSSQTASAAELLISVFKPYFPVRLIGQRTYGKPVGFLPIHIDQYQVFLTAFLIRNAEGWSDYFDGMEVDVSVNSQRSAAIDDSADPFLAAALQDIGAGLFSPDRTTPLSPPDRSYKIVSSAAISPSAQVIPLVKRHFTWQHLNP